MGEIINEVLKKDQERFISAVKWCSNNIYPFGKNHVPELYSSLIEPIISNSNKDYPSLDNNGVFCFSKSKEDPANKKNRVTTTLGRYIRRNLGLNPNRISDKTLNGFTDNVLGYCKDSKVKILKGNDITKFYKNTKIQSCMTGGHAYYTELYALNPKNVFLAVLEDNGAAVARAMLWKLDNDKFFLDRIYSRDNGKYRKMMEYWADKQGYAYNTDLFDDKAYENAKVILKAKTYLPYLDTMGEFAYYSKKNKKIMLSVNNQKPIPNGYKHFDIDSVGDYSPWINTEECDLCAEGRAIKDKDHKHYLYNDWDDEFCFMYVCNDCLDFLRKKTCSSCKKKFYYDYRNTLKYFCKKNQPICAKCTEKYYFECDDCSNFFLKKFQHKQHGLILCAHCNTYRKVHS